MSGLRNFLKGVTLLFLTAQFATVHATSEEETKTVCRFYYFGYGSNLLADRIHIQNPIAERVAVGVLRDYRLDFYRYTERWDGAVATIVPTPGSNVSGALWIIIADSLEEMDNQEGVNEGVYEPIEVAVELANKTVVYAQTYSLVKQPSTDINKLDPAEIPEERQPSKTYLRCLVKGAIETGLPESYINGLRRIKHNGRTVDKFEDGLCLRDVILKD